MTNDTPQKRRRKVSRTVTAEEHRGVRLSENYYKRKGYTPEAAEAEAEKDFQLAEVIRKRRRKLPQGTPH